MFTSNSIKVSSRYVQCVRRHIMKTSFDDFDFDNVLAVEEKESAKRDEIVQSKRREKILSRQFYPLFRGFPNGSKEYYDKLEALEEKGLSEYEIMFSFMETEMKQKEQAKISSRVKLFMEECGTEFSNILNKIRSK